MHLLQDPTGSYDLHQVVAITPLHQRDDKLNQSKVTATFAGLMTAGGQILHTVTDYATAVERWVEALSGAVLTVAQLVQAARSAAMPTVNARPVPTPEELRQAAGQSPPPPPPDQAP